MAWVQQSVMRDFRNRLFEKYQRLSLDYFHSRRTGQVMSRVTNDVVVLNESIDLGFNRLVADSITVVLLLAFLIILSWKLTLLASIVLPVVFAFIWYVGRKLRKYSARSQERMADVNSVLEEAVNNVRIVKAFSMEKFETGKFFGATKAYFRALVRMTRIRHLATPINDFLTSVAGVAILMYAGSRIISGTGELGAGDFMTFVLAMFSLIKPVKSLSQVQIQLQEGMAAAQRVFEVIDTPERITEKPQAVSVKQFQNSIKYDSVSFAYNENEPVLKQVSFEVKPGDVVAVVGPSGAGKSTLLDLLPRFYDPQHGKISIDGVDIRDMSFASLRGMMGIVTQETFLFNDSIRNNIAYGLEGISESRIIDAATMANAHEFISQFEHGYDTVVGNRGVMLSGGQRQRLAIARALLKDPQILIFDEATSSLDTESEILVQQAIERLMEGRTTLVIAHRLSTIRHADRILVLSEGEIVEQGTHAELMRYNGLYARLYSMQFRDDA
jgi:subfamily B ATP-binding cassette protein MsbA